MDTTPQNLAVLTHSVW